MCLWRNRNSADFCSEKRSCIISTVTGRITAPIILRLLIEYGTAGSTILPGVLGWSFLCALSAARLSTAENRLSLPRKDAYWHSVLDHVRDVILGGSSFNAESEDEYGPVVQWIKDTSLLKRKSRVQVPPGLQQQGRSVACGCIDPAYEAGRRKWMMQVRILSPAQNASSACYRPVAQLDRALPSEGSHLAGSNPARPTGVWRSLVARSVRDREDMGAEPITPTRV
jgi:hypothetical protein